MVERYSSRKYDDEFRFSVRRRCDHVVKVPLCSVDGGMSRAIPVSHHVAVAEEFVEVCEIALACFSQLKAFGFEAFSALLFNDPARTA